MSIQFLSRTAIRPPMKFPPALQKYITQRLAQLAASAAQVMRTNAPRDDGELIAGIRSSGTRVQSTAPHSTITEWGAGKKMPKQRRKRGEPKLSKGEKRAAKKAWKAANVFVPAQPFFFRSIFEARDRMR
jgi:uncharacterized protein (UPF0210 family)